MDKKEAVAQLKLATQLFRDGEVLLKSNPQKGEEKIQEALAISLKIVEASPNTIEAYQLASQIFLRRGDRRSWLHYSKGYQFLKSGGKFPDPEMLPQFEYIEEIREEIKPKTKKKELQKESTVLYPPKLIPFPKPVLMEVTREASLRALPIPSGGKPATGRAVAFRTTPFLRERITNNPLRPRTVPHKPTVSAPARGYDVGIARFNLRRAKIRAHTFEIFPKSRRASLPPPPGAVTRLKAARMRAIRKEGAFSGMLPAPPLSIKIKLPGEKPITGKTKVASMKSLPALPLALFSKPKMQTRRFLLPATVPYFGVKRPQVMRSRAVPPKVFPVFTLKIKVKKPAAAKVERPLPSLAPRSAGFRTLPVLPSRIFQLSARPFRAAVAPRPLEHPQSMKSLQMPLKVVPMPMPRKRELHPPAEGRPAAILQVSLKQNADFIAAPPIVAPPLPSVCSRAVGGVSIVPQPVNLKPRILAGRATPVPIARRLRARDREPVALRLLRTRKPTLWFVLPAHPVASSTIETRPRMRPVVSFPLLFDYGQMRPAEIGYSRLLPMDCKSFVVAALADTPPIYPSVAWRRGLPKAAGHPVILSFSPSPVKKAPIQMQVPISFARKEMRFVELPVEAVSGESVLDRIEGGEHPLMAFALELDQEGEQFLAQGNRSEAVEVFMEGAAALIEAGEVQGAAEMFVKALKCVPGNLDILKRLDRLQIQGAILRPEVKLEIQRKIYGLKV